MWLGGALGLVAVVALARPRVDIDPAAGRSAAPAAAAPRDVAAHPAAQAALVRRLGRSRQQVPILMYHVIGRAGPAQPYPQLIVSPGLFRAQVRWLHRHGFHAVTLRRVVAAWHGRARLPAHPVVLTFDDGYLGDQTVVRPVLAGLHWPGVLNLIASRMRPGDSTGLRRGAVRELLRAGWELDSHTTTHPDLTTLSRASLRREVSGSRVRLQRMFGVPVTGFCYPAGRYDRAVLAAVRRAGYRYATTELDGVAAPGDRPLLLPRIRVAEGETPTQLGAAVRTALSTGHSR
jgi:peptidoglycan/xylan/chitin deacetylase (PgdA/CDA1 family)